MAPQRLDHAAGQHRRGAAAMGKDPADVGVVEHRAVDQDAGDGARRLERIFDRLRRQAGLHGAATGRCGRMRIDDGLAAVEFLEDRRERRIAEIFAVIGAQQPDAVGFERIERIGDFRKAAFGIGQRDDGEQAIAAGIIADRLGGVIVPHPRQPAAGGDVAEPGAGRAHRNDRGRDAVGVHLFERLGRRPRQQLIGRHRAVAEIDPLVLFLDVGRRQEVVMHVDALCGRLHRRRLRKGAARGERGRGGQSAGEKLAASHAAATGKQGHGSSS